MTWLQRCRVCHMLTKPCGKSGCCHRCARRGYGRYTERPRSHYASNNRHPHPVQQPIIEARILEYQRRAEAAKEKLDSQQSTESLFTGMGMVWDDFEEDLPPGVFPEVQDEEEVADERED